MTRTITVKGVGSVSTKPDYIALALTITAKNIEYEKAMEDAARRIGLLEDAIGQANFVRSDLKTLHFNVNTQYETVQDRHGNYQRQFAGYACTYRFKLAFDFDSKRLSTVLTAIAGSGASPELSISFTVKKPAKVSEELLASAAANAKAKAEILCRAFGAEMGQLFSIDYNWGERSFVSQTRFEMEDCIAPMMAAKKCAGPEIEPDDINLNDTACFVWEIK